MFRFIFDIRAVLQPAAILFAALLSPAFASAPLTAEDQPATPLPIPRGALIDPDADEMPALAASGRAMSKASAVLRPPLATCVTTSG